MVNKDRYKTIQEVGEGLFRDRGSRFIAFAYPVQSEEAVREHLAALKKKYYDATHHCYAWRLGPRGEMSRSNDDGEPSGSAGKPILGQILSQEVTDSLVIVVRYFGGTELGIPGLINAYRTATLDALKHAGIVTVTEEAFFEVIFPYLAMNDVMRIVKANHPRVVEQVFDNVCRMEFAVPRSEADALIGKLEKVDGMQVKFLYYK